MITLTKEWLHQTIAEYEANRDELPFGLDTNSAIELQAFKMALASLEAEAVAWRCGSTVTVNKPVADDWKRRGFAFHPLYAAPPEPVVPHVLEEIIFSIVNAMADEKLRSDESELFSLAKRYIEHAKFKLSAAMLQGAYGNSPVAQDGWTGSDEANAALIMLDRIETVDSVDDDRIEGIKRIIRGLAEAPQQECKHEFVYGWHSYGSKSGYQCRFCGKLQEVK
ncbi:hypothetical protein ABK803_18595 [Enterobacter ludwigii]|uniref:hypothetical protein n=1 Tax=Enterobacter ludwigii TaxID=299767 RepID=UPI003753A93E